jgi:hypothetical protein
MQGKQEVQEFQEVDKDEGGGDERCSEMEFLDTNLTKDLSLWLHAIFTVPFYWRILQKTTLYSGF